MKKFYKNNPARFYFWLGVIFVTLLTAFGVGAIMLSKPEGIVARVGEKNITKEEYESSKNNCEDFYKFNEQKTETECTDENLDDLILKEALLQEAAKRNITVTDKEIDEKLKEISEPYENEEEYLALAKRAYGWDKEYIFSNLKRDILKEKLQTYILNERSVVGVYYRYDWDGKVTEEVKNQHIKTARDKVTTNYYSPLKSGTSQDEMDTLIQNVISNGEVHDFENISGLITYGDLTAENATERFASSEDWGEISKLKSKGDITPVFVSGSGYVAAYRLEDIQGGNYNNWNDYLNDQIKNRGIIKYSSRYNAITKTLNNILGSFGIKNALAYEKIDCTDVHFSSLYGKLREGGNINFEITGATIKGDHGSIGDFPKCKDAEKGSTSIKSRDNGYFKLGKEDNGSFKALSCFVRWDVTVTHPKYETIRYDERSVYGNGIASPLDHRLSKHDEKYAGAYRSENTDGDNKIYLKLKTFRLTVKAEPTTAATPTGSGLYPAGTTAQAGYSNILEGWSFQKWTGDCNTSGRVVMNGTKTCTANFTENTDGGDTPSCEIRPESGTAPLVVIVSVSGGTPPYDITMEPGQTLSDRTSPVYYTYQTAGDKTVTVMDSDEKPATCTPIVSVTSPTSGGGGEVAP